MTTKTNRTLTPTVAPAVPRLPHHPGHPVVIQGGMGTAISSWRLANAVARTGQLGVVSGTALDVVCARRLQDGDPGGHVRRALAAFPVPTIADRILATYFVPGGIGPDTAYRPVLRHTTSSARALQELTVAANFVEVFLAKEGHTGPVGINYLHKIDLPLPASCYGALLAGVDYVCVGAGNPADIPALVRTLARHEPASLDVRVVGARAEVKVTFDPADIVPLAASQGVAPAPLALPKVLAIIASVDLAEGLVASAAARPDGFIVEGPLAGGHNAPPRGPRQTDELGQPVYGERDEVDIARIVALGLPVWLAGACATPEDVRRARSLGATGVQAGTVFALADESGLAPDLKEQVRRGVANGDLRVRADWRVSPTGFPFRVAELPGTWTDPAAVAERRPVCDLGFLRSAYLTDDGKVDFRCPAEPEQVYLRKGGRPANREGRVCLCNALFAACGMAQRRGGGVREPALVTTGADLEPAARLMRARGGASYAAADVVEYLLGEPAQSAVATSSAVA